MLSLQACLAESMQCRGLKSWLGGDCIVLLENGSKRDRACHTTAAEANRLNVELSPSALVWFHISLDTVLREHKASRTYTQQNARAHALPEVRYY